VTRSRIANRATSQPEECERNRCIAHVERLPRKRRLILSNEALAEKWPFECDEVTPNARLARNAQPLATYVPRMLAEVCRSTGFADGDLDRIWAQSV
jgi:hypothetical protein